MIENSNIFKQKSIMKKSILNLEGVEILSKTQMKHVNGSGRRNCVLTGNEQFITNTIRDNSTGLVEDVPVSHMCEWKCDKTFLGIKIGTETVWGGCSVWG